uniref:DNA mismatch repair protein S5 domain-containing protein n=1 Tax=Anopheles coluzzii TaxID=1518534 RepID=A0A8W7P8C8_ANOCL
LAKTHAFYDKHGGKTIIFTRFVPIIRTFAPFVAGIGSMGYRQFTVYNVAGAVLWVAGFCYAGYFFGNLPFIRKNLEYLIFGIIFVSFLPAIIEIAAGEVVERPASALKEMLENSLDSGASKITVDLAQGGIKLIRVTDNGGGIAADDLPLALDRHATSKIASLDDLSHAYQIIAIDGQLHPVEPAAHANGTSVEVVDLYFNTPARRKFLKSENTEYAHCEATFERIALAHPQVEFLLRHNGKVIWRLPAQDLADRVAALLGKDFITEAIAVETSAGSMTLSGFVGSPTYSKASRDAQYFYVNGRFVRDKTAQHALRQAYRDVLHHDRHPVYALFLSMDPAGVDVNVHPTKIEVRFRESQAIHQFLFHSINKALAATTAGSSAPVPAQGEINQDSMQGNNSAAEPQAALFPPRTPFTATASGSSATGHTPVRPFTYQ